jgi:hypothetical protein
MNNNLLMLSVYSRTYKAANDEEQGASQYGSSRRMREGEPLRRERGWDPFEVWRTRVRAPSTIDPLEL